MYIVEVGNSSSNITSVDACIHIKRCIFIKGRASLSQGKVNMVCIISLRIIIKDSDEACACVYICKKP